jgi:manganese-dependent inorganic pyrophosphatase
LYKIFRENDYKIDSKVATMLMSAIISDSLFFRSPTTTKQDIKILDELNKIARIENLESFARDMFVAKSDL